MEVHETCDTQKDFHIPYSSTPIYKQACGYSLVILAALVIFCTSTAYFKPTLATHPLVKAFDARYNTIKLNYTVLDPEQQELVYIFGLRTLYLSVCIYAHFIFVSGLANAETHSKYHGFNFNNYSLNFSFQWAWLIFRVHRIQS